MVGADDESPNLDAIQYFTPIEPIDGAVADCGSSGIAACRSYAAGAENNVCEDEDGDWKERDLEVFDKII